jgi:5-methylcytosine-specific restriction endonuclease McrA
METKTNCEKKKTRKPISKSLKNNVWIQHYGEKFKCKCSVTWCATTITPFTFEVGHNQPHSKGGTLDIDNLMPICSTCNKSMGDRYTITEFSQIATNKNNTCCCIL